MSAEIETRHLYPVEVLARLVPEVPAEQLTEALDILARLGHIWRAESGPEVRYAYRGTSASQTRETDENDRRGHRARERRSDRRLRPRHLARHDQGEPLMTTDKLPASICRVCGNTIREGKGTALKVAADDLAARLAVSAGPHHDWSRMCDDCARLDRVALLRRLTGDAEVTEAEADRITLPRASEVLAHVPRERLAERTGKPWRHVGEVERERLRAALDRLRETTRPSVSPLGACGLCGVRTSIGWTDAPPVVRWPDGSRAPMCSTCTTEWDRLRPTDPDGIRAVAAKLATGLSAYGDRIRYYAETRDADGNGYAEPWTYSPRIEEIRDEAWLARPDLAPEDRREHYLAIRREYEQRLAAERAAAVW